MQATIYVTKEAFAVANRIKDLGYSERMDLQDTEPDLPMQEGYCLKNINHLRVAELPADAHVALRLVPEEPEMYQRHVTLPSNLRGCVFEGSRQLQAGYAEAVMYWSGAPTNSNTSGSAYFQNPHQEYMIDLSALNAANTEQEIAAASLAIDKLLSEGVVVAIKEVDRLIANLSIHDYIELKVPVLQSMVGLEGDDFRTTKAYPIEASQQVERVFLMVADILASPNSCQIYIDLIRTEMIDYGFWY